MLKSLLLALLLVSPLSAAPKPRAKRAGPPGAATTVQIPVTGSAVDAAGRRYTFSGSITLTLDLPTPTPSPQPVLTKLETVLDPATTLPVLTWVEGQRLILRGESLYVPGTPARLQFQGRVLAVTRWSPTEIEFSAPTTGTATTSTFQLYWNLGAGWILKGQLAGPWRSVMPSPEDVTPIVDFQDDQGRPVDRVAPGARLTLSGRGFGTAPGQVTLKGAPMPVLSWTDELITVRVDWGANPYFPSWYGLRIPGRGAWGGGQGPWILEAGQVPLPLPVMKH